MIYANNKLSGDKSLTDIFVFINSDLNELGKAQTLMHEFFGHAYFYFLSSKGEKIGGKLPNGGHQFISILPREDGNYELNEQQNFHMSRAYKLNNFSLYK